MTDPSEPAVFLRDVTEADLEIFFEQQLDAKANEMAAFPPRDRRAHMDHWHKIMADPALVAKTIMFGDRVAGNVGSWQHNGEQEVGYWIGRPYWGRGIATSALSQFVSLVVRTRPLHAYVAKNNAGSIRVLEKCGFKRAHTIEDNGVVYLIMVLEDRSSLEVEP